MFEGIIHSGIGESQLSTWLASVNLPVIGHRSLKTREREVGGKIVDVAKLSCQRSLERELNLRLDFIWIEN